MTTTNAAQTTAPNSQTPCATEFIDEHGVELQIGDLVMVRGPWQMGSRLGDGGSFGVDSITGRVMRVVALRANKHGPHSAALADASLIGVDESDEVADCVLRRLVKHVGVGMEVVF